MLGSYRKHLYVLRWKIAAASVLFYIVGIRWLLFDYLYAHDMMGWYSALIDAFNELTRAEARQGYHPLDEFRQRTDILLLQIVALGFLVKVLRYALRTRQRRLLLGINVVVVGVSLLAAEMLLRTDKVQALVGGPEYVERDRQITEAHIAAENSYGFTDRERSKSRGDKVLRVAVLGDSFVWGDGLENLSDVWSHRLESMLTTHHGDAVEVLSWGRRGWSTYTQLQFLKQTGVDFEIDFVMIGYVSNDSHVRGQSMARRTFIWDKIAWRITRLIPSVHQLVTWNVNNLLYSLPYFENWGYQGWLLALYTPENLKAYRTVLEELREHLAERGIPVVFVLTPTMQDLPLRGEIDAVLALLDELEVPYVDVRETIEQAFGHYGPARIRAELWANPVDAHPGVPLHAIYAEAAYDYLMRHPAVTNLHLREASSDSRSGVDGRGAD